MEQRLSLSPAPSQRDTIPSPLGIWSGHIGYLGLGLAMDSPQGGLHQLKNLCVAVQQGATLEEAFEATFGRPLSYFHAEFEAWKAQRP